MKTKKISQIRKNVGRHWVGDGFPVRSLLSYEAVGMDTSPFLLLDYAGPAEFQAANRPRGVGQHPHRGFETVTIVYQGEVAHRDSTGQGGMIGPGDVQWMTAGAGILHEEFHSEAFTRKGGTLEMIQLWVNLPAKDKMTEPAYQAIVDQDIPVVDLPDGAGRVRVIAGRYRDSLGPAHTFTPMQVWDVRLNQGNSLELALTDGWNTALLILHGSVIVNGQTNAHDGQLVLFDRLGDVAYLHADSDAVLLLLSGEPINEPIAGHGPFVMNTREEIDRAITDYNEGVFGDIAQ